MKIVILLFIFCSVTFAQHPQDYLKNNASKVQEPRVESEKEILVKKLIDKNCGVNTRRKDIETESGDTFDTYQCDKNMFVYIDRGGDRVHLRILSQNPKTKNFIELVDVLNFDEVRNLNVYVNTRYKDSNEYKTAQDVIEKRKKAVKDKQDQIKAEKNKIIENLLE